MARRWRDTRKNVQPPTQLEPSAHDDRRESHPAWGLIGASRVQASPGGVLFDSDILHRHYVVVRLQRAERGRSLVRDWLHGTNESIVEIAMSEAQWASFVSTMNVGQGVPCTIERVGNEYMPEMPHEPRLAETLEEVEGSAKRMMDEIQEAFDAYREKKTAANLRALESAIRNAPANVTYAAETLSEHAESVVQRARADVEAMVTNKAVQLGIDPAEIAETPLLGEGDDK